MMGVLGQPVGCMLGCMDILSDVCRGCLKFEYQLSLDVGCVGISCRIYDWASCRMCVGLWGVGFFNNETQHPSGIELPCLELTYDVGCGVCWSVGTSCRMYVGLWGSTIVDMMGVLGCGDVFKL